MSIESLKRRVKMRDELKEVLNEFSENSSAHAPPKIVRHKFILAKVFWTLLFLAGVGFFIYFSQRLVRTYMKYETATDIELTFDVLKFPAVTFCNHNQFRRDRLPKELSDMTEQFIMSDRYQMFGGQEYFYEFFQSNPTENPLNIPWWVSTTPLTDKSSKGGGSKTTATTGGSSATTPSPTPSPPPIPSPTPSPMTTKRGSTTGVSFGTNAPSTGVDLSTAPPLGTGGGTSRRRKRAADSLSGINLEVINDMVGFYQKPNLTKDGSNLKWFSGSGNMSSESAVLLNLTQYIASYASDNTLRGYGHDIQEMLQECTFQGRTCAPDDFYQFYDREFGNCYTFNSGMDEQVAKVTSPGSAFGLSLTLFINQPMYVPVLSKQAGVRVLLHRQGEVPLVAEEGFNAPPGTESAVSVRYVEISRLPGDQFSNCTSESLRPQDGSLHEFYPGNYTQQACLKTCLQKGLIAKCGCANALYRSPSDIPICDLSKIHCVEETEEELLASDVCSKSCPIPCWESQYQHTISTSQWPSNNYEPYLVQTLKSRSKGLERMLGDSNSNSLREEFVKLEIYFDNLNFYRYKERASMSFEDLIGALGGHLGLWIGMSVISFVEVFELLVELFGVCAKVMCCRRENKVNTAW